ncbi:MAG: DUF1579 family protein [Phycisphaerales bacterium]
MKVTNTLLTVVALAGLATSVTAGDDSTSKTTQATQTTPASVESTLGKLAGEWEGTVEIRWNEKETSSSIASVSAKTTDDGSLLACFEGYAKGERFEGSMRMRVDSDHAVSVSYDGRTGSTSKTEGKVGEVTNVFTMSGEADHPLLMKKVQVRQVARLISENECSIEWLTVEADGKETPKMRLNLVRMQKGELSSANSLFDNSKLLSRVDSKQLPAVASVDEK